MDPRRDAARPRTGGRADARPTAPRRGLGRRRERARPALDARPRAKRLAEGEAGSGAGCASWRRPGSRGQMVGTHPRLNHIDATRDSLERAACVPKWSADPRATGPRQQVRRPSPPAPQSPPNRRRRKRRKRCSAHSPRRRVGPPPETLWCCGWRRDASASLAGPAGAAVGSESGAGRAGAARGSSD